MSYHIISYICYICILYIFIYTYCYLDEGTPAQPTLKTVPVLPGDEMPSPEEAMDQMGSLFFIGQNSKLDVWVFINLCVKWNIDIAVWKSIRNSNTKITVSMIPRSRRDVFHLRNWTQIVLLSLQNRDIFHCEFSKVSQFLHRSWFPQQNPRLEQLS